MGLVDDYKSGYSASGITANPIYPNAAWAHKFTLETGDITGLTFEIYARETVRSNQRCFNIDYTQAVEDGNVVLYPLAINSATSKAFLNKSVFVTCQFIDDVTGNIYIVFEGEVEIGVGSTSSIVDVPNIPGSVVVPDGDYGGIVVSGNGYVWSVKESEVVKHKAALGIPESLTIANDLITNEAGQSLAAAQGVVLKGLIDAATALIQSNDNDIITLQGAISALGVVDVSGLQAALDSKATSAQGLLANSAVQPGDNISSLVNNSGFITDYNVIAADVTQHQAAITIGKSQITAFNDLDYATASQGLLSDSAVQPGDNISVLTNDAGYVTQNTQLTNVQVETAYNVQVPVATQLEMEAGTSNIVARMSPLLVSQAIEAQAAAGGSSAAEISTNVTNFNNNLSAADINLQLALDTLDELVGGAGPDFTSDKLDSASAIAFDFTANNTFSLGKLFQVSDGSKGFFYDPSTSAIKPFSGAQVYYVDVGSNFYLAKMAGRIGIFGGAGAAVVFGGTGTGNTFVELNQNGLFFPSASGSEHKLTVTTRTNILAAKKIGVYGQSLGDGSTSQSNNVKGGDVEIIGGNPSPSALNAEGGDVSIGGGSGSGTGRDGYAILDNVQNSALNSGELAASQISYHLDEANNKMVFTAKYSNGIDVKVFEVNANP